MCSNSFELTGVLMSCSGSSPVLILLTNTYCVFTQEFDDDFKQIMVTLEQMKKYPWSIFQEISVMNYAH